jgi:hypothetical protein
MSETTQQAPGKRRHWWLLAGGLLVGLVVGSAISGAGRPAPQGGQDEPGADPEQEVRTGLFKMVRGWFTRTEKRQAKDGAERAAPEDLQSMMNDVMQMQQKQMEQMRKKGPLRRPGQANRAFGPPRIGRAAGIPRGPISGFGPGARIPRGPMVEFP